MAKTTYAGYTAAAATALSTELNSLTNGSYSAASAAIDNTTNLDLYADFELNVTYGTAPVAGASVDLFLVPSLDGTNYGDGGGAVAPAPTYYVGSFPLRAVTTAQKVELSRVPLTPGKFKLIAQNNAGQTTAASGNTISYRTYGLQTV